ncbi:MAG: serine/threonine-protein kinase [Acidobacteriota bacterium]
MTEDFTAGLAIGSMVGEYRVEQLVGEGGMGQVYGAVHPVIGKRAAIKVLQREMCSNPDAIRRFVMEARAVNQIGHPNIVDVFAFGALPDGRQYMVMEWLRGETLSDRMRRARLELAESCDILLGVCAALDAAHEKEIVHRDLKPQNVFLVEVRGARPLVKLLDFGLVKLMGTDDQNTQKTRAGALLGTPAYMSPEQARGYGIDTRTDVYSLGIMAFEMFTGQLPFDGNSAMELVIAHMQAPPPLPSAVAPGLPPELEQLIVGLLAKDPAQRPTLTHTMAVLTGMRDAMLAGVHASAGPGWTAPSAPTIALGQQVITGSPVTMPGTPNAIASTPVQTTLGTANGERAPVLATQPRRRARWPLAAAAVVVVGAAVGIVAVTRGHGGSDTAPAAPAAAPTPPTPAPTPPAPPIAVPSPPPPPPAPTPPPAPAPTPTPTPAPAPTPTTAPTPPPPVTHTPPPKPHHVEHKVEHKPATTPSPQPPADDDGLLDVTPKKK